APRRTGLGRTLIIIAVLLLIVGGIGPMHPASMARAQPGDGIAQLVELAERLLSSQYGSTDAAELLVGRVPDEIPFLAELPGGRVLGSVVKRRDGRLHSVLVYGDA